MTQQQSLYEEEKLKLSDQILEYKDALMEYKK
jgi:hypothetical protein